jgi:hypothetical protein
VIPFKFFPEILPRYFPSDPLQVLSRNTVQIFHWYISKYFPLEKYLQNQFSSPYIYFLHNFPHAHTYTYASSVIRWALQANLTYTRQIHAKLPLILSSPPPHTHPLHVPHKHTLAQGSFDRSSIVRPLFLVCSFVHPIVRSFVWSFMVRSSVCPIVRSFVHSFVQIIFFLPLCCRNSDRSFDRSFDRSSFVHSSYSSFVHSPYSSFFQIIFVLPLCCRNSDHSFVRSLDRSSVRSSK